MAVSYEVADVVRQHLQQVDRATMPMDHYRVLDAISKCRTLALGSHLDGCDSCGHLRISYNSCRNRHCPKCQGVNKEMWVVMQEDLLLPVTYYHVVYTLPHELNLLCMYNPREMYHLLFRAAWYVINKLGADPGWLGAQMAATMLLHTWGQQLHLHPHVHCIVPNGGLDNNGEWRMPRKGHQSFLFPVKAMQKIYKGFFMGQLLKMIKAKQLTIPENYYKENGGSYHKWKNKLYNKDWVVYTKKPFSSVKNVIDYVGRYSHKIAITNRRILDLNPENRTVKFKYKDYRDKNTNKEQVVPIQEFVRRFRLHILPKGFRKVRQFGFSSNASKKKSIAKARQSLGLRKKELLKKSQRKELALKRLDVDFHKCPHCKEGQMKMIMTFTCARPPPGN